MAYAHQGIELKQIPGLGPQHGDARAVAEAKKDGAAEAAPGRPSVLTKRGADALIRVERLMDDATRGARDAAASRPKPRTRRRRVGQGTFASASDQPPAGQVRGD